MKNEYSLFLVHYCYLKETFNYLFIVVSYFQPLGDENKKIDKKAFFVRFLSFLKININQTLTFTFENLFLFFPLKNKFRLIFINKNYNIWGLKMIVIVIS